jgi:MFS family permease
MFGDLSPALRRQALLIVVVAALGYFVDIFDLLLFGMVRIKSLVDLGVTPEGMLAAGGSVFSWQMRGMLVGGLLWGILGDKRGRLSVLFGSIITYSIANIANAYVHTVGQYELWRFIAGVGLAGELGAGITLVAEVLPKKSRGIGTSIVAGVGILGAVVGYFISKHYDWRTAYQIGGCLGLLLLLLRFGVHESGLFRGLKGSGSSRGDLSLLVTSWPRFTKYMAVIGLGLPLWYMVGILVSFSPEFAQAAGMGLVADPAKALAICYLGLAIGDLLSGLISQALRSRKKAVLGYMCFQVLAIAAFFNFGLSSEAVFYPVCFFLGLSGGYWALFVTIAAEQFGTDIRATVTTTVPNFVRGALALMLPAFLYFKEQLGQVAGAGMAVGAIVFALSFWGLSQVEETFSKDLDYIEAVPEVQLKLATPRAKKASKAAPKKKALRRLRTRA